MTPPTHQHQNPLRSIVAASAGNLVEWFVLFVVSGVGLRRLLPRLWTGATDTA